MSGRRALAIVGIILCGMFGLMWLVGFIGDSDLKGWCQSLPYSLGFPVFMVVSMAAVAVPVMATLSAALYVAGRGILSKEEQR